MYKHYEGLTPVKDIPTTKLFNHADDKNVAAVLVYANSSGNLFYDQAFEKAVPAEDCLNLFVKGVVCLKAGSYYIPTSCTAEGVMTFAFN